MPMESSQMPILKTSRSCRAGEAKSLKKALRISAKLKEPFIPGKRGFYVKEKGLLSLTKRVLLHAYIITGKDIFVSVAA